MLREGCKKTTAVSLRRLLPSASFVGCGDILVRDATDRSDCCRPGVLFAARPGTRTHGREFVGEALSRGASALLVDFPVAEAAVPQCVTPDVRRAYSLLCHALHGQPSRRLHVVGVTGTNGKSTTCWLVRSILQAAGKPCGVLGTIEYHDGRTGQPSSLTTPEPKTFFAWLHQMAEAGTRYAAVELSSHALDQDRVAGLTLRVAVVTNVTHDHLDYHGCFEAYAAAKAKILDLCAGDGVAVLNRDDPAAWSLRRQVPSGVDVLSYGLSEQADVRARILSRSLTGSRFELQLGRERVEVQTQLPGDHNVQNCLAAAAAAWRLGLSLADVAAGVAALTTVPGRLERVDCGQPFAVLVDYAHTPDALARCLRHLRTVTPGRLLCVFGAGGDRDRLKRPELGRAASQADVVVVTSDNPRSEPPEKIIEEILQGVDTSRCECHVEPDRRAAIDWVLRQAQPGDCVLIAGKGHETEQVVGNRRLPFDDRQVVRELLTATVPAPHSLSFALRT